MSEIRCCTKHPGEGSCRLKTKKKSPTELRHRHVGCAWEQDRKETVRVTKMGIGRRTKGEFTEPT